MKVPFYTLKGHGYELIGCLRLVEGKVVADPPTKRGLLNILTEPICVWLSGEMVTISPQEQPELFLQQCHRAYHGSYFRAGDVED